MPSKSAQPVHLKCVRQTQPNYYHLEEEVIDDVGFSAAWQSSCFEEGCRHTTGDIWSLTSKRWLDSDWWCLTVSRTDAGANQEVGWPDWSEEQQVHWYQVLECGAWDGTKGKDCCSLGQVSGSDWASPRCPLRHSSSNWSSFRGASGGATEADAFAVGLTGEGTDRASWAAGTPSVDWMAIATVWWAHGELSSVDYCLGSGWRHRVAHIHSAWRVGGDSAAAVSGYLSVGVVYTTITFVATVSHSMMPWGVCWIGCSSDGILIAHFLPNSVAAASDSSSS